MTNPIPPSAQSSTPPPELRQYKDDDLVYVDPDLRIVVGLVEWNKTGNPKPLPMKEEVVEEEKEKGDRRRVSRQRFYPWGTYRSMKKVYKLEGKQRIEQTQKTLDDVLEKALKEPFWN